MMFLRPWLILFFFGAITVSQTHILDVKPLYGPHAGGTMVAISMNDTAENIHLYDVWIGQGPCSNLFPVIGQSILLCNTKPSGSTSSNDDVIASITVMPPSGRSETFESPFIYKPNPSIETIHPAVAFLNGGTFQTVTGRNLDSVAFPAMHVFYRNDSHTKDLYDIYKYPTCEVVNSSLMLCTVPKTMDDIQSSVISAKADVSPGKLFLNNWRSDWFMHFYFDGLILGKSNEYSLRMSENPIIDSWQPQIQEYPGDDLTLTGQRLNYVAQIEDYNVTVGGRDCVVTHLSNDHLICKLPGVEEVQPKHKKLMVLVKIGLELEYEVGYLNSGSGGFFNQMTIIIISCASVGFLLLCIGVVITCRILHLRARRKTMNGGEESSKQP